jgi:hypothetical protein
MVCNLKWIYIRAEGVAEKPEAMRPLGTSWFFKDDGRSQPQCINTVFRLHFSSYLIFMRQIFICHG